MIYDFDTLVNRRNTNSLKWNVGEGELPMWVADMDFQTAPEIRAAIAARAAHGVFGYTDIPDAWYDAYLSWWERRHSFSLQRDWLIFCTGAVPAISSIVRKLTTPAEKVVVPTPSYNIFFNSILNNGRQVLECPLVYDGRAYHLDFAALEEKLADPQTSLMILCNPQNPTGNIWDRETLAKIGDLAWKYHVIVISDELHCDLTEPGYEYVPFASVSAACRENSVTCLAPTKTFNLAGLQTAAVSVPNAALRHKVWRGLNTDEVAEPNAFAVDAAIAAFTEGAPWLDALREYLWKNRETAEEYLLEQVPQIRAVSSHATYLMWLDCSEVLGAVLVSEGQESSLSCAADADLSGQRSSWHSEKNGTPELLAQFIRKKTGLYLSEGGQYGGNGSQFLRLNLAAPRSVILEGMERLYEGVKDFAGI